MKVLIFSMTCGEGHNSIAKSLKQEIDERIAGGGTCKIVQAFGFDNARIEKENQRYLRTCKTIPHIYDFIWNRLRKRDPNKPSKVFDNEIKDCEEYFIKQIEEFCPDVIICTHYYASGVIQKLKQKGKLNKNIITATIVFDFCLSPYWEFSNSVDYIFSPTDEMNSELISKNYKQEQIKAFGIPIRSQFGTVPNEKQEKPFTVLMIAGGNGIGNTLKAVKSVVRENADVELIVINGKNKKTFNQIENYKTKHNLTNIQNLGFVLDIEKYFAQADAFISRCGGCGMSEMLCFETPFIIRENMIINEKINKKMFIAKGCALGMNKIGDAGKLVKYLKNNPARCQQMSQACKSFAKPNATRDIVDFLIKEYEKRNNLIK